MKKRLLSIIIIALLLTGCGGKNLPSDTAISCAEQAIDVVNDYLNGKSDYDSTKSTLDKLTETMDYVTEPSDEENNPNHSEDLDVQVYILSMKTNVIFYNMKNDSETRQKIQEDLEKLEDLITK